MRIEANPTLETAAEYDQIFEAQLETAGGLEALQNEYGLGQHELSQNIQFGTHSGTMLEAMTSKDCPLGGIIRDAYKEGGIELVQKKLFGMKMIDDNFNLDISPETLERSSKKK